MSRRLSHESAHDLLPWYVTGTLAAEERRRVEDHVKSCLMCHHELLKERELHTLMQMNPAGDIAARCHGRPSIALIEGFSPCEGVRALRGHREGARSTLPEENAPREASG